MLRQKINCFEAAERRKHDAKYPLDLLGPVSLRQYELVYGNLTRKRKFLVYSQALSHRSLRGI